MAANINVTYDALLEAATKLAQGREEFDAQLTKLQAMVNELVSEDFVTDIAAKSLDDAYGKFNHGIKQAIEGLDTMSKFLTDAERRYREADDIRLTS